MALPAVDDRFRSDLQRCLTGSQLHPAHFDAFSRLIKSLVHGATFQFVLAEVRDQRLRDRVIEQIDDAVSSAGLHAITLDLVQSPAFDTVQSLENKLVELAQEYQLIHLRGADQWLQAEQQPQRWQELNIRRDAIAESCRAKLIWWLSPEEVSRCATEAPDLWSWRSGVYAFSSEPEVTVPVDAHFAAAFDTRSLQERSRRAAQLKAWLGQKPPNEIRLKLTDELADILFGLGELDAALRIRQEEELPVYEKLGDVLSRAMTQGRIADILHSRGELDAALRIRQEEELPVYEKLGDVRALIGGRAKLAITLLKSRKKGHKEQASALLGLALSDAQKLGLRRQVELISALLEQVDTA